MVLMCSHSGRVSPRLFLLSAVLAALLLFVFFTIHQSEDAINARNTSFQNGDLVFVRGRTWRSCIVRLFDVTDDFSHVGIVRIADGAPKVIHASPEADVVQLESMEDFLSPANIDHAGVYRLQNGQCIAEAASLEALGYFERGVSFDHRFNILLNDMLYCTELVWLAYKRAGIDLGEGESDFLYDAAIFGEVLLPGRLSKSRRLIKAN